MTFLKAPWFKTAKRVQPGAFLIQLDALDSPLPYDIKINKRRVRVSIEISQGLVCVKAPPNCTVDMIEQFITQQQGWIAEKLASTPHNSFQRHYESEEPIYFLGEQYQLKIKRAPRASVALLKEQRILEVTLSHRTQHLKKATRKLLHDFYLYQAEAFIPTRLSALETATGLQSTSVEFKFYQWRWGCCYSSGKLRFNPLLMAAPLSAIDCVIIHELCHLKHMDHSKAFWRLNEKHCKVCRPTKTWLKQHHNEIYLPAVTPKSTPNAA